jgi:uncharacterized membrane protein YphA (DoxX/SURF4 family)
MILLRVSIGWHLMFEGYVKLAQSEILPKWGPIATDPKYARPFSAEQYLRESTGPLRFYFRGLVDDFHGVQMLDREAVERKWDDYVEIQAEEHGLGEEARGRIASVLDSCKASLAAYLEEKSSEIAAYTEAVRKWEDREQRPLRGWGEVEEGKFLRPALSEIEQRAHKREQKRLDEKRQELTAPVLAWTDQITAAVGAEIQREKSAAAGSMAGELAPQGAASVVARAEPVEWRPGLHRVNFGTMWGLTICGLLMVLGLFTRTACLGGAFFLALFYLSMPPWPGLDPAPVTEGTYLYVNKNLVELLACVMLATTPVGVWGGLDSIVRGAITRPLFGVGKREVVEDD